VTAGDLDAAIAARSAGPDGSGTEATTAPSAVWLRMAERVTASWTSAPHFYLFRDVEAGRLAAWRGALEDDVTLTDLLVWLTARALRRHPEANARWDGGRIVRWDDVNVGIAVAVEDGLVVPVIHAADRLGVGEIAERRKELVDRSRSAALRPEDVAGGTFTLSNLGMYGVDGFAAVVNAPQAAILAVGRVTERVMAVEGRPVVRPGMSLALSCDHRVLDGARAARFLATLAGLIEEPLGLMT
jgi:pyruvate dehydrogenase E2 component (dihydrolipoamide acetyltransferase)